MKVAIAYEKDGSFYVMIMKEEVEVDEAGMVYPEGYSEEVISAFDAIEHIKLPNGEVLY